MRIDAGRLMVAVLILAGLGWGLANIVAAPPQAGLQDRPALAPGPVPDAAALQAIAGRLAVPAPPETGEPVPAPAAPVAHDVRLIGLVESDTGWVALLSRAGEAVTARPGETAHGYRLVGIDARSVVLEREGEHVRLELDS